MNGTQAAIRAGYSERTARQIASENLSKPNVEAFIAELVRETWVAVKRLAAKCAIVVFGLSAILWFAVAAVQLGAEALSWKAGTWGSAKTIAVVWPAIAGYVDAIELGDIQRIGLWLMVQPVMWAYLALSFVFFAICGIFMELHDSSEQRRRWRHSLEVRSRLR